MAKAVGRDNAEPRKQEQTLATPIDFEQLIADGILKKWGAWYQVLDWKRLPEHVRQEANAMKAGGHEVLIQFA